MNATEKPLKLPLTYYWSEHFSMWVIRDGDNHQIAQVENKAKAHLIVKAVNLHEEMVRALEESIVVFSSASCSCNEDRDCQRCHANRKVRAIIAKVKEESKP